MSSGGQPVLEAEFPDPVHQAEALLEVCQGDICEAREIVGTNLKFASQNAEQQYWRRVEALLSQEEPSMVMERLLNCRLRCKALGKQE